MTTISIVKNIEEANLVSKFSKEKLATIADDVIARAEQDKNSMKDWIECVEKGKQLCKPEFHPKSEPWPGAANFKSTLLTEAANTFGNRASLEVMRQEKLVSTNIVGADTIKNVIDKRANEVNQLKNDLEPIMATLEQLKQGGEDTSELEAVAGQIQQKITENEQKIKQKRMEMRSKYDRADRVAELMNWQINHGMPEWREDQTRLMYSLPLDGTKFKETYYDDTLGRCVSRIISYPDFYVNQATTSLNTCRSFTHVCTFSKTEVEMRRNLGIWEGEIYTDKDDGDTGSNEQRESEAAEDNPDLFYKQYGWLDIDGDGIDEPYIITVHVASTTVVRITARYNLDTIIVRGEDGRPLPLLEAQNRAIAKVDSIAKEYGVKPEYAAPDDLSMYEIVRIEPVVMLTKYGLIPSFDGTFLDLGFYHFIGATAMGVNKTTNDLLNAGTLANTQGGVVAKDFRKKPGSFAIKPGEFIQTECSPQELQGAIIPLPYKEPSQALFALNEKLEAGARAFGVNIDAGSELNSNTAPTTALAMIQESLTQHTAHMRMIIESMGKEFKILFTLNRDYFDGDEYVKIVGDDESIFADDFDTEGLVITCGANPEMSSRMQRMMIAEAEMAQLPMVIQAGGNAVPIVKGYYERIGSENLDKIFPNEAEMSPDEKAQMQAMRQAQEQANQMAQAQLAYTQLQTELLKRDQDRKDQEFLVKSQEIMAGIDKTLEEINKLRADTTLTYEKAETEQVNNKINTYTAHADQLSRIEDRMDRKEEMASESE